MQQVVDTSFLSSVEISCKNIPNLLILSTASLLVTHRTAPKVLLVSCRPCCPLLSVTGISAAGIRQQTLAHEHLLMYVVSLSLLTEPKLDLYGCLDFVGACTSCYDESRLKEYSHTTCYPKIAVQIMEGCIYRFKGFAVRHGFSSQRKKTLSLIILTSTVFRFILHTR